LPRPRLGRRLLRHFDHVGQRYRIHNAKASAEAAGVSLPASCAWTASHQKRRTQHYRFKDSEHMTPFRPFLGLVRVDSARIFDNILQIEQTIRCCAMIGGPWGPLRQHAGLREGCGKRLLRRCRSPAWYFCERHVPNAKRLGRPPLCDARFQRFGRLLVSPPLPICPGRTLE
jgi:hypothetical protein